MGKNRRWIQILVLLAVVIIGGYAIGQSLFFDDKQVPREGGTAPAFSLSGIDNKRHDLSDYTGKLVIINFWATWCTPCKAEMPAIQRQYDKWKDQGVEVIGINLGEGTVTVQSFVRQYGLTFPILYDPDWNIRDKYAVNNYPTTFFLDRDGKIAKIKVGEMDESFIERTIRETLAK